MTPNTIKIVLSMTVGILLVAFSVYAAPRCTAADPRGPSIAGVVLLGGCDKPEAPLPPSRLSIIL